MKTLRIFLFLFIGIFFSSFAQGLLQGEEPDPEEMVEQEETYANLPLPSEILVVYNANIENSEEVASYYQQERNIPSLNLCPITDLPTYVDYGQDGGAYLVNWDNNNNNYLAEDGEVILSWTPTGPSGKAHWLYYKDYIEDPIKDYMNENDLTEDIRYIVLIKGLPYRLIRAPSNYSSRVSAAVCALLSLMNQPDERDILTLYNTPYWFSIYYNPYLGVDYPPTMDYRFQSGHFENAGGWYLNYLVSRLDADTYDDVIDLIDRITSTDKSGEKKWILDNKPDLTYSTMPLAADRLDELGFNYIYDNTNTNITSDNDEVIGYSSHGYYAFWDSSYIWTQLQFDYVNGAIFNSWESGNALSYGKWHWKHGLLSDFNVMSGSGGGGNANEPLQPGVYKEGDSYPAYAMGYSIVDAIYQGINYIAWQNDIIGDPLETIAWGKQTLTQDVTWSGTNLVTGIIKIPSGNTLTIANGAVINFKHDGALEVEENGTLTIQPGVALNFYNSSSIVVEGTLDVQGSSSNKVTFDRAESSGTWGSIIFDGSAASNSIIYYANILFASDIQCLNGADVTIQNSIIEDCTQGIYIYNSAPLILTNQIKPTNNGIYGEASVEHPFIQDNDIIKSESDPGYQNYQGIWFTNSTRPYISHNDIAGFYHAIYLGGGTVTYFSDSSYVTSNPNNRLIDSRYGLTTGWGSTTLAGISANQIGSYNSIYDNSSKDVYSYQNSTVLASYNYWGGGQPNKSVDATSILVVDPILTSDPWGESSAPISNQGDGKYFKNYVPESGANPMSGTTNSDIEDLLAGLILERDGRINEAILHYKQMLNRNVFVRPALTSLASIANRFDRNELLSYFEQLVTDRTELKAILLNLLATMNLHRGNYNETLTLYDEIIIEYGESYEGVSARLDKFFAALNYGKAMRLSSNILRELESLNITDEELLTRLEFANYLLRGNTDLNKGSETANNKASDNQNPNEFELDNNYPNPFNPITTIDYSIEQDGLVSLKVYDVLGAEVVSLVNENQVAGNYSVQFDAFKLPSGIYFYRLSSGKFTSVKKLILLK